MPSAPNATAFLTCSVYESIEGPNAKPVPSPGTYNRIEATWRRYLGRVLANEMPPAAALEEADKEFTTILASR
jgi:ABC-type glycerol-3-phosphate transport system substrate-binding protein